tara:strand:+ start:1046 stop:2098 length:1053 start_codon:yes stop_codon:yes gene_type:complete
MSENDTANQEVTEEIPQTSKEEKFFGVKHTIEKTPKEESAEELQVEVIDDRPKEDRRPPKVKTKTNEVEEEIDGISDKVQKRIDKIKYDYHEERRAKEASDKLRDEAVGYAKKIQDENKRLSALINKGEEALLGQISAKASAELEQGKSEFKEAYEAGDTDKMLAANEKILSAQVDAKSANEKLNYYQKQTEAREQMQQQQNVAPQQTQQPVEQHAPPDPKAVEWLQKNTWFGSKEHKDMTGYAYGLHETLIQNEGIYPTSDQYYQEVDKRMRGKFPEFFGEEEIPVGNEEVVETVISKKPSAVVAPATRNNGALPRKVQLTGTQVALARRLGLTPEQYAKQVAKEVQNG